MSTGFQKDRNIERQTDRQSDRLTDRQTDRQKVRKTKVVKNVNRMSEKQSRILYRQLKSPLLFFKHPVLRSNLFILLKKLTFFSIPRMCCHQSRTLAQHQNIHWAFKNISPLLHPVHGGCGQDDLALVVFRPEVPRLISIHWPYLISICM